MQYEFEHTGITVTDLEKSIQWYRTNFGFETITPLTEKPKLELRLAKIRLGDFNLEIIQPYLLLKPDKPKKQDLGEGLVELLSKSGANHLAFIVDDVNQAYQRFQQNKVTFVTEVLDSKYFFCQDIDGVLIEVRQRV